VIRVGDRIKRWFTPAGIVDGKATFRDMRSYVHEKCPERVVDRETGEIRVRRDDLTRGEYEALVVLGGGMASRSAKTRSEKVDGIHTVSGSAANRLIAKGLARAVPQWKAVEITEEGEGLLA
jgi:hypothetical protein